MSVPPSTPQPAREASEFQRAARRERSSRGAIGEFWYLLSSKRKWWMTPIIVALLLVGAIIVIGGTAAGPLIYTLF
jgi:hypothetical protein